MPRLLQVALAAGQAWHRPKARANLAAKETLKIIKLKGQVQNLAREKRGGVGGSWERSARSLNKLQISRLRAQMRRAPCYVCRVDLINDLRAASGAARAIELCAIRFQ